VHSRRELLASIAVGNRYLSSLVLAMATTDDPVQKADYIDRLHAQLAAKAAETGSTQALMVLDRDGVLLATSEEEPAQTAEETAKVCRWSVGDNTITEGPELDPVTGVPSQPDFVHAVVLRAEDLPIGLLCGRFRMDIRQELARAHTERTSDADVYLVDSAGRLLCNSTDGPAPAFDQPMHDAALQVVRAGQQWVGRYDSPTAGPAIAANSPMPTLGWGILLELPDRKALAAVERLKWEALILGAAFVALMIPVMFATARATARPLHTLADAARRVESGVVGEPVSEVGAIEVVQLARSFNRMSTALKEAHDLLEGRIAERTAALQRSQEFSELLLDSIEQRVLVVDAELRVLKANRAAVRLHGQPLVGERCASLLLGDDGVCLGCPVCEVFATGQPTRAEITVDTVRGKDILQVENFPVLVPGEGPGAAARVEAVVQIGRVVTAEKQLVAQAMHQEKMAALGLLAAGLAHEIGNPLASIQSQLRLVREMPDSARAKETLPVVEKQVQRISGLLRELSDFARRKRDDVVLVSAAQVIEDVARLLGHDPRSRSVDIVTDAPIDLPGVRAREDHLVQVLLNLGLNAIDAMPEGGTLRLESRVEGAEVVLRVRDTGTGIAPLVQERLFEPFLSTKESGRGTGLGLFVSRGIVEGLGGTLVLEQTDGLSLLRRLLAQRPDTSVLVMTAYASVDSAIEALRSGAADYLIKPVVGEELVQKAARILAHRALQGELLRLRRELSRDRGFEGLVGDSPPMQAVRQLVEMVAPTSTSVLITGESGTGKELVARAIHTRSQRASREFMAVNMAALPAEMVEAQLFGHERGAFTGADRRRDGILRAASGGTVFLDELVEMPIALQAKLLRALESGEVLPVGADRPVRVDVRLVAATHQDLAVAVQERRFRQDLLFRLDVMRIPLPPLRERREDIPTLADHFLQRHARAQGRRSPTLSNAAMRGLLAYDWPGNVRELSNVLERATILSGGQRVEPEHLPMELRSAESLPVALRPAVDRFERQHIAWVLRAAGNNRERAAEMLEVDQAPLYRRLARWQQE